MISYAIVAVLLLTCDVYGQQADQISDCSFESPDKKYKATWQYNPSIDGKRFNFTLEVQGSVPYWTGIGFGQSMSKGDMIIATVTGTTEKDIDIKERHTNGRQEPIVNQKQYLSNVKTTRLGRLLQIKFERPLKVDDDPDMLPLEDPSLNNCQYFMFPVTPGELGDGHMIKHTAQPTVKKVCDIEQCTGVKKGAAKQANQAAQPNPSVAAQPTGSEQEEKQPAQANGAQTTTATTTAPAANNAQNRNAGSGQAQPSNAGESGNVQKPSNTGSNANSVNGAAGNADVTTTTTTTTVGPTTTSQTSGQSQSGSQGQNQQGGQNQAQNNQGQSGGQNNQNQQNQGQTSGQNPQSGQTQQNQGQGQGQNQGQSQNNQQNNGGQVQQNNQQTGGQSPPQGSGNQNQGGGQTQTSGQSTGQSQSNGQAGGQPSTGGQGQGTQGQSGQSQPSNQGGGGSAGAAVHIQSKVEGADRANRQCPSRNDHEACKTYVDDYLSVVYTRFQKSDPITQKACGLLAVHQQGVVLEQCCHYLASQCGRFVEQFISGISSSSNSNNPNSGSDTSAPSGNAASQGNKNSGNVEASADDPDQGNADSQGNAAQARSGGISANTQTQVAGKRGGARSIA